MSAGQLGLGGVAERGLPSVRLSGFTPTTYDFLSSFVEEQWGHPALSHSRPTVIPFEPAAALYFILRATPDQEFPGGKWATLQHLESVIERGDS